MKWSRSSSFELPVPMSSGVHGQLEDLERLDFGGAATPTGDERPLWSTPKGHRLNRGRLTLGAFCCAAAPANASMAAPTGTAGRRYGHRSLLAKSRSSDAAGGN